MKDLWTLSFDKIIFYTKKYMRKSLFLNKIVTFNYPIGSWGDNTLSLHNISIHQNFYQNRFINENAGKILTEIQECNYQKT